MKETLTSLEAFKAMTCFLEKYYQQTLSEDIGSLLGDLQILEDGKTVDPAAWADWINCILKAHKKSSDGVA